jgi:hypothetical protein
MSYVSDLQSRLTPEQFTALVKPVQFQVNKSYKGQLQDWQAQILTPLDTSKVGLPTQLTVTTKAPETYYAEVGEGPAEARVRTFQPELDKTLSKDFAPQYEYFQGSDGEASSSTLTGYRSKKPVTVNGLPVYANYDVNGKLTGYDSGSTKRAYMNDSTSLKGVWDASGVAKPKPITSSGGGFIKGLINDVASNPVLNTAITIGAGIYGGPAGVAAWNAAQTKAAGGDWSDALESGAKAGALAWGAQQLGQSLTGSDIAATNAATDQAMIDLANSAQPEFSTVATDAATNAAIDQTLIDLANSSAPVFSTPTNTEAFKADNIDVGGGYNPATGTGDLATANAAAATGVSGSNVTVDQITDQITGNADKKALYGNEGYGETLTSSQIDAVDKAVAGGMSLSDAINMVKGGLLINSLTGDPLGLSGNTGGTSGTTGKSGFSIVPVPADWKSPTYAPISAPIDLSTVLTSQNMLGGTQWENLPTQRNISFNDIFASGQQQTPMGSPVDLNNIVSAILGQAATSQKPA